MPATEAQGVAQRLERQLAAAALQVALRLLDDGIDHLADASHQQDDGDDGGDDAGGDRSGNRVRDAGQAEQRADDDSREDCDDDGQHEDLLPH